MTGENTELKRAARLAVAEAIRKGLLTRQPCQECGTAKVHAHHHLGYEPGHWLDVEWLCATHHSARHFTDRARRHRWRDIRRDSPESRVRVQTIRQAMTDALALGELREQRELKQTDVAGRMGVAQPQISRLERREDLYLSTLREYVEALGGELHLVAEFPDGERVRLDPAAPAREALPVG